MPDRAVQYRLEGGSGMSKQPRRRFTPEFKEQAVAGLSGPGATQSDVARELGVTSTHLKTWRLEL
jgi:transposase-like protein